MFRLMGQVDAATSQHVDAQGRMTECGAGTVSVAKV